VKKSKIFEINKLSDLGDVSEYLISLLSKSNIFLLKADLGSGKTSLCSAFLKKFADIEHITSPTFNILNQYQINDKKIFHYDLYRLKSIDELYEIGFEESLNEGIVLIEWPEIAQKILAGYKSVAIEIETTSENSRKITITED
jgi:tRNA threonylcarbamoyladenosine biosynthesis protein TsaE